MTPQYTMDNPDLIECSFIENSISLKRVKNHALRTESIVSKLYFSLNRTFKLLEFQLSRVDNTF